jgi:hypothetical protein
MGLLLHEIILNLLCSDKFEIAIWEGGVLHFGDVAY